jgi:malate dehydrogenase
MVDAIVLDKKQILPCAAYLEGEFGLNDIFCGVPVMLGAGGIEEVLEIELSAEERQALHNTASSVRQLVQKMGL